MISQEILNLTNTINALSQSCINESEIQSKTTFLIEQLLLLSRKPNGLRYNSYMIKLAMSLYLKSRNCYSSLRNILSIPHPNTVKNYFGDLGMPGDFKECENTIKSVFEKLNGRERYCKLLVDEIHIKAAVRYRGNHVVGYSHDEPSKIARTVLAIMIAPSMGKPAFICRLIPIYSLKTELLFSETVKVIELVHKYGGYVFLLMSDNLRANQSCFD